MSAASGLAVSVQTRLVRHAKALGVEPNLVLARFAVERFLYRLSRSAHADRFVLKGALLMLAWLGEAIRPTRDADLLGFGELSEPTLARLFSEVCKIEVQPDGVEFLASTIRVFSIRPEDAYGGLRATLQARLGNARLPAIAEKLHAMVVLGAANSRMRDFFDIFVLAEQRSFEADVLTSAVRATFERRRTPIPPATPLALTAEFGGSRAKQMQWQGFLRKNRFASAPAELSVVVARIGSFLGPAIAGARTGSPRTDTWAPGGPWTLAP